MKLQRGMARLMCFEFFWFSTNERIRSLLCHDFLYPILENEMRDWRKFWEKGRAPKLSLYMRKEHCSGKASCFDKIWSHCLISAGSLISWMKTKGHSIFRFKTMNVDEDWELSCFYLPDSQALHHLGFPTSPQVLRQY